jgi:hypothetical protein
MHDVYLILNLILTNCDSWDQITLWLILLAIICGFKAMESWNNFRSRRSDRKL